MKKLVVVGAGGLGGTIAALLAQKGVCDVTIVGRPGAHIDTVKRSGVQLNGLQGFTIPIEAVDDATHIRQCDGLILAVKAQDTQAALTSTAHIHVREFVASVQNGVIKDDILVNAFGKEKVLGAVAILAGERPAPGVVNWTYDGGTQFGELDGQSSARVDKIVDIFQQAGLITESSNAIVSATWSKMAGWIPIGLLATLSRQNNAGVLSNRLLATAYVSMIRELSTLATVKEIPLIDLGPYPVKTWCQGTVEEAVEKVMTSPLASSQSTHSALQDIQKDQPTEFSACVGPMIADASQSAIPIPRIQVMYAALMGLEATLQKAEATG